MKLHISYSWYFTQSKFRQETKIKAFKRHIKFCGITTTEAILAITTKEIL